MSRINTFQKIFVAIVISMVAISSGCASGTGMFGESGVLNGSKLFPGTGGGGLASTFAAPCSGSS